MSRKKNVTNTKEVSSGRKMLFTGIMLLITVFFFLLLELGLRLFHYGNRLELFTPSKVVTDCYSVNPLVSKRFFSTFKGTEVGNDIFLINKPDTCFRIFVMGCSTARGFPFQMSATFSRILHRRLQDLYPHTRIEVVNTAMAAINSYAIYDFIDEVLEQKPDLVLIYTGHNEYYGALGVSSVEGGGNVRWLKLLNMKLVHLRTYQLMQKAVKKVAGLFQSEAGKPKGTLMTRMATKNAIDYDSELYRAGIGQFTANMDVVLEKCQKQGVKLAIGELVSNLAGLPPLVSSLPGEHEAVDYFRQARQLEKEGDYAGALDLYTKAKDRDAIIFRAPEGINEEIHRMATSYGAVVVPMKQIFQDHSPHGIPGFNLFTEHLHPNLQGYFLMADAFFNTLMENKMIPPVSDSTVIRSSEDYRKDWGFTALDSVAAELKYRSLMAGWPFKATGDPNDFFRQYHPRFLADSLALRSVINPSVKLEDMHTLLAKRYAASGWYYQAYLEYASLIQLYPYAPDLYITALKYLMAARAYEKAAILLKRMPGWEKDYTALATMGQIQLAQGLFADAVKWFQRARKQYKAGTDDQPLMISLFTAEFKMGDIPAAQRTCKEIWIKNPDFQPRTVLEQLENKLTTPAAREAFAKLNINAQSLVQEGDTLAALKLLKEGMKTYSDNPSLYFSIGTILLVQGKKDAISYLEKSYAMNPFNPKLVQAFFTYYVKQRDFINAKEKLDELGRLMTDATRFEQAKAYYNSALRIGVK